MLCKDGRNGIMAILGTSQQKKSEKLSHKDRHVRRALKFTKALTEWSSQRASRYPVLWLQIAYLHRQEVSADPET
ncbi:MAG: hypothetical protein ABF459_14365 [Gluconobacter cerinus]|uniref:hypothetical protein n=1 Tax=Gluconobacter cerinus TaxID=38307 RepID=UPI0039ED0645